MAKGILFLINNFWLTGCCLVAERCRNAALIRKSCVYKPHLTFGLLRNTELPEPIIRKARTKWNKLLAEDYLSVNHLTEHATVELINDNLQLWDIIQETEDYVIYLRVKFLKHERRILAQDIWTNNDIFNFKKFVVSKFHSSKNVYSFILSLENALEKKVTKNMHFSSL